MIRENPMRIAVLLIAGVLAFGPAAHAADAPLDNAAAEAPPQPAEAPHAQTATPVSAAARSASPRTSPPASPPITPPANDHASPPAGPPITPPANDHASPPAGPPPADLLHP